MDLPELSGNSVCLVTSRDIPDLTPDDRLLHDRLMRNGWQVEAGVWSDPTVAWEGYRAVIVRSCWDYHRRVAGFREWLDWCEDRGVQLWNPPATMRWNLHKSYLVELSRAGLPVVPTEIVSRADRRELGTLLAKLGWEDAVVKPAIGASAYGTFRTSRNRAKADQARLELLRAESDLLVQPFVPEVELAGELSFLLFGGQYSHTVLKRGRPGEFRVQAEFGGSASRWEPTPPLRRQAERIAAALPVSWLYLRIDAVVCGGELRIMEVELIEPELFFRCEEKSADRLVAALARVAPAYPGSPEPGNEGPDLPRV